MIVRQVVRDPADLSEKVGAEVGADGLAHGRDPRQMTVAEIEAMGHRRMSPTQAIRAHCLDCCAGSPDEVRKCMALKCPSWPYRMGGSPWRAPPTETQLEARREAGRRRAASIAAAAAKATSGVASGPGTAAAAISLPADAAAV